MIAPPAPARKGEGPRRSPGPRTTDGTGAGNREPIPAAARGHSPGSSGPRAGPSRANPTRSLTR